MARRKVPSQVATGAETFSDSLVGRQITDGTSQLTNTNFAIDRIIPEKDSKKFNKKDSKKDSKNSEELVNLYKKMNDVFATISTKK